MSEKEYLLSKISQVAGMRCHFTLFRDRVLMDLVGHINRHKNQQDESIYTQPYPPRYNSNSPIYCNNPVLPAGTRPRSSPGILILYQYIQQRHLEVPRLIEGEEEEEAEVAGLLLYIDIGALF